MSKAMRNLSHRFPELVNFAIGEAFKNRGFLTWNSGIEMWSIDRPIVSCTHCTSYCWGHCYTRKAYRQYHHAMPASDIKNEYRWTMITGEALATEINFKNRYARSREIKRVRFCSKGEPFSEHEDILKIQDIALMNPNVLFWVPTRAWRRPEFSSTIETKLFSIPNLRILASIDPSNTKDEVQRIDAAGWSKMFFGIDKVHEAERVFGIKFARCPKTHEGRRGSCQKCNLCFGKRQMNVHLKEH